MHYLANYVSVELEKLKSSVSDSDPDHEDKQRKNKLDAKATTPSVASQINLNAFTLFRKARVESINASESGLAFADIQRKIGKMWKECSEEEKTEFRQLALAKSNVDRTVEHAKSRKHGVQAFILFRNDKAKEIKRKNPEKSFSDIQKEAGREWKKCSKKMRSKYMEKEK